MNRTDKDRFFKQLAVRYVLAQGQLPCPEVVVYSPSDLTQTPEPISDLDVLGLESLDDGRIRRTLYDCKTGKMSAINRAMWARGVMDFASVDHTIILLKKPPQENHRLASLQIAVDLHTEDTFTDLALLSDASFNRDLYYQSSADSWSSLQDCYAKYPWTKEIFECIRFQAPIAQSPAKTFRRLVSIMRHRRGEFDPNKVEHRAVFLDAVCGMLILWSSIARDVRRIFRTNMTQFEFASFLRNYIWGGQEAYQIRREMAKNLDPSAPDPEMPEWGKLEKFTSNAVSDPRAILGAAWLARELAIREATTPHIDKDNMASTRVKKEARLTQFYLGSLDYLASAAKLPPEFRSISDAALSRMV